MYVHAVKGYEKNTTYPQEKIFKNKQAVSFQRACLNA